MTKLLATLALIFHLLHVGLVTRAPPSVGTGECFSWEADGGAFSGPVPDAGRWVRFEGTRTPDGGARYYLALELYEPPTVPAWTDRADFDAIDAMPFRRKIKTPKHPECWLWLTRADRDDAPTDCVCDPDAGFARRRVSDAGYPTACTKMAGDPDPLSAVCR